MTRDSTDNFSNLNDEKVLTFQNRFHYERFLIWHLFGHCVVQFSQQTYMANDGDKRLLVVMIERRTAWSTLRKDCGHGIQTTAVCLKLANIDYKLAAWFHHL